MYKITVLAIDYNYYLDLKKTIYVPNINVLAASPPLSPSNDGDDAFHVGSILESVCNSKEISSVGIAKLCEHVKADSQEQQVWSIIGTLTIVHENTACMITVFYVQPYVTLTCSHCNTIPLP